MAPAENTTEAIRYFSARSPLQPLATAISYRARQHIYAHFSSWFGPRSTDRVLDVGVTPDQGPSDANFFERCYPFTEQITATSVEDARALEESFPGLTFVQTKGVTLPFEDAEFDLVFCSAVIEHVGDRQAQRDFVSELLRVSKHFYLTTPNRWFPVDFHTQFPVLHWLPQHYHQAALRGLGRSFWAETANLNLLSETDLRQMFPPTASVAIERHRLGGLGSNLLAFGTSSRER